MHQHNRVSQLIEPINSLDFRSFNAYETAGKLLNTNIDWSTPFSRAIISGFVGYEDECVDSKIQNLPYGLVGLFMQIHPISHVRQGDGSSMLEFFRDVFTKHSDVARWYILYELCQDDRLAPYDGRLVDLIEILEPVEASTLAVFLLSTYHDLSIGFTSNIEINAFNGALEKIFATVFESKNSVTDRIPVGIDFLHEFSGILCLESTLSTGPIDRSSISLNSKHIWTLPRLIFDNPEISQKDFYIKDQRVDKYVSRYNIDRLVEWAGLESSGQQKTNNIDICECNWAESEDLISLRNMLTANQLPTRKHVEDLVKKYKFNIFAVHNASKSKIFLQSIVDGLIEKGFGDLLPRDEITAWSFAMGDFEFDLLKVEEFLSRLEPEIVGAYTYRCFSAAHSPSRFGQLLFEGLIDWSGAHPAIPTTLAVELYTYARMRTIISVRENIKTLDVTPIPNGAARRENFLSDTFEKLASHCNIARIGGSLFSNLPNDKLFHHLPERLRTVENKLLTGIPLTHKELRSATPRQRRHSLSNDIDL